MSKKKQPVEPTPVYFGNFERGQLGDLWRQMLKDRADADEKEHKRVKRNDTIGEWCGGVFVTIVLIGAINGIYHFFWGC